MLQFLVESPYEKKLYRLEGDRILIGRSRAAEIPLLDDGAKKRHVLVSRSAEGSRFEDLSGGKTRRNGSPESEGPLKVGDRLEIASTVVTLQAVLQARGPERPKEPAP
ncbi:MAG: FHA domain-containing protein, partial [Planctomycetota bacterium]